MRTRTASSQVSSVRVLLPSAFGQAQRWKPQYSLSSSSPILPPHPSHTPATFLSRSKHCPHGSFFNFSDPSSCSSLSTFPSNPAAPLKGHPQGECGDHSLLSPTDSPHPFPWGSTGRDGSQVSILPAFPACLLHTPCPPPTP